MDFLNFALNAPFALFNVTRLEFQKAKRCNLGNRSNPNRDSYGSLLVTAKARLLAAMPS
jgi:hypothetical protein